MNIEPQNNPTAAPKRRSGLRSSDIKQHWKEKIRGNTTLYTYQTKSASDNIPVGVNGNDVPSQDDRNYIKAALRHRDKLFWNSPVTAADVYVSVSFLIRIAAPNMNNTNITIANEQDFMKSWKTQWDKDAGSWKPKERAPIAIRDADGKVKKVECLSQNRKAWEDFIDDALKPIKGEGGKPPRHRNIHLRKPLYIVPVASSEWPKEEHLRDLVTIVNEKGLKARGDEIYDQVDVAAGMTATVGQLAGMEGEIPKWSLAVGAQAPDGYMLMSQDPFNLYESWIHREDWSSYMRSLENPNNDSAVRVFPTQGETAILKEIWSKIGAYDRAVQDNKLFFKTLSKGDQAKIQQWNKDFPTEVLEEYGTSSKRQPFLLQRYGMIKNVLEARKGAIAIDGYGRRMLVDPTTKKMAAAVGRRKQVFDQVAVMGGSSATKIANAFRWDDFMRAFSPAEWLHLSAFSWGGLASDDQPDAFASSQMNENLVFGTSETNSLMTRYEYGWQKLFLMEEKLSQAEQDGQSRDQKLDAILAGLNHATGNQKTETSAPSVERMVDEGEDEAEEEDDDEEEVSTLVLQGVEANMGGNLFIRCNRPEHPLQFDHCERGIQKEDSTEKIQNKYSIRTIDVWPTGLSPDGLVKYDSAIDLIQRGFTDGYYEAHEQFNTDKKITQGTREVTFDTMRAIANDYPFIVHSIEYNVEFGNKSRLLNINHPKQTFVFFPFRRPFYHRAEHWLDDLVFKGLVKRAVDALRKGTSSVQSHMGK